MISISILPRLLLAPIAGVFGDWFDRKKIITLLNFANSLIIGAFAVIYILNESLTVGLIYLFVILLEITEIFFHSSESAVLPSIVTKDQMMDANATNSLIMNIGQLLSPMLASILYGSFGLKIILIASSISFLLSAISKLFMDIPKTNVAPEKINLKAFRTDLMEGIKIIKSNKKISSIIGIGTIVNFCISPLMSIGLIYIIKGILKTTDFQFGLFQSVVSLSLIAAPLFCSGFIKKIKLGNLCFMSFFSIAILILAMALVPASFILDLIGTNLIPYIVLLVLSFFIGIVATIVNIAVGTLFNQIVPLEMMGRTSSVFNLAVTVFIPIGQMLFGYLYDIIPASYVIILSGVILLLGLLRYKSILLNIDNEENMANPMQVGDFINEI